MASSRDTAKKKLSWILPLLTAVEHGSTIQTKAFNGNWTDMSFEDGNVLPAFAGAEDQYRVKPDPPQEILVYSIYVDGSINGGTPDSEYLDRMRKHGVTWTKNKPRKFVEVIEEQ